MMRVKRAVGAAVVSCLLFAGCSEEARSYRSVQDLATALEPAGGCEIGTPQTEDDGAAVADTGRESLVADVGTCSTDKGSLQLFVFASEDDAAEWTALTEAFEEPIVLGPTWAVITPNGAVAEGVQRAAGGELRL